MQFRKVVPKSQPEFVKNDAGRVIGMGFTCRSQQIGITAPESEIVSNPLAETKMQTEQLVFSQRSDFCLLLNRNQRPQYSHCRINRRRELTLGVTHFSHHFCSQEPLE